jgi:hypothetical protein
MLLVGSFGWWYGVGWRGQVSRIGGALARANDWFSIPLLLKTLFSPFRQISANETGRDIRSKFRAWGNRLFSRCIGAFLRFFMIIFGGVTLLLVLILSLIRLILWPIFPVLPVAGVVLMLTVGTPWNLF